MKLAVVGLGKMGSQIALRLTQDKHEIIGFDVDPGTLHTAATAGIRTAQSREEAVAWFGGEAVAVWLMIPAGVVDAELQAWLGIVPAGSTIIDGGNSDFRLTRQRAQAAHERNIHFIDVGTSGGILGIHDGFSMMIGGEAAAVHALEPVFTSLAAPRGGYEHFGPSGAGHYIKMIHNAVEYGMMESLAEGYHLLHDGPYADLDLAAVARVWQHGSIVQSKLGELILEIVQQNPTLTANTGYVAESGEARWALDVATEQGIAMPAVEAALDVRLGSESGGTNFGTKLLAALRNKFGGHEIKNSQM